MSAKDHAYRRKQVYIKKGFQFKFMLRFCLVILIGAAVSTALLLVLSRGTLTTSFHDSRLVVRETSMAILPAVIYTNLITMGLISLASIFVTLFVSHKIAGPLYRFELEINRIAEGDLTRKIQLRQNDQVTEMANCLNRMTDSLRGKLSRIKGTVAELEQSAGGQQDVDAFKKKLSGLKGEIDTAFLLEKEKVKFV